MDGGDRMGGIGAEEAHEVTPGMAGDHRVQHRLPAIGAVNVAGTRGAAFRHAEPVEQKQRMVARAVEMPAAAMRAVETLMGPEQPRAERMPAVPATAPVAMETVQGTTGAEMVEAVATPEPGVIKSTPS